MAIDLKQSLDAPLTEAQARVDLAAAHHMAVEDGLTEGTWNHFSLMLPGGAERMLMTPCDRHWSQVNASSLVVVDDDSEAARSYGGVFWVGYRIHYPVHQARPQAACMMHAHPMYTTALSMLGEDALLPASQHSSHILGRVGYNDRPDELEGDSEAQGHAIDEALGDKQILVLRGHGVVVIAPTVAEAYHDLYLLELAARSQILAMSTGAPIKVFSPQEAAEMSVPRGGFSSVVAKEQFAAMRSLLDARGSDYAS